METPAQREGWILSARERSTVISPDRQSVYSFDLEGRLLSWFREGRVYKRSLASEVHARQRDGGKKRYWRLRPEEAATEFARVLEQVAGAPSTGNAEETRARIAGILRWTPETLLEEQGRFAAAYRPVNILPPDQYLSIVLQATFGCSWNRCSFCSFYANQPFRTRSPDAFRNHCHAVRRLLGRGASLRKGIFLASGNALMLHDRRLLPLMRTARETFPDRPIAAFVDVFTGERREARGWRTLRDEGLDRVHVGLETGHDKLLRWLNKPGSAEEALQFVSTLKGAGLKVALILMVGVGGDRFAEEHVTRTISLLARLSLERGDRVYLSPFVEQADSAYAQRTAGEGVRELDSEEHERQYVELRDGIRDARPGVTVARYDLREFVY